MLSLTIKSEKLRKSETNILGKTMPSDFDNLEDFLQSFTINNN